MTSNLEKYKQDLKKLTSKGDNLLLAMQHDHLDKFKEQVKKRFKKDYKKVVEKLPSFVGEYQSWYSESLAVVKFLLPDRVNDFVRLYEKPKVRKSIDSGNYVIEDYLQGLSITHRFTKEKVVGPDAAIPKFQQQLNILKSAEQRFESSLFDIKHLVQADLFDSELEAAKELNKKGFVRGAGAIAGVVLEGHLAQVCENHKIKIHKKSPGIGDLNGLLKKNDVIETSTWRFIQHLGDLRNKCDHKKQSEPTRKGIEELIEGVEKIIKTLF